MICRPKYINVLGAAVQVSVGTVKVTVADAEGGVFARYPAKNWLGELALAALANPKTIMAAAANPGRIFRRVT